ncbi:hypothetical protein SGPA1_70039 [Streptomyces misionensis JCM 4497]
MKETDDAEEAQEGSQGSPEASREQPDFDL